MRFAFALAVLALVACVATGEWAGVPGVALPFAAKGNGQPRKLGDDIVPSAARAPTRPSSLTPHPYPFSSPARSPAHQPA